MCRILSIVLAGGAGTRLLPLTKKQAKPALPFVHQRRIIDFVLSNLLHSGLDQVLVLTQYQPHSLHQHLRTHWQPLFSRTGFLQLCPAAPQLDQGTAGAVVNQLSRIRDYRPDVIAILSADHVYKMDYRQMLAFHQQQQTAVTVAAAPVPLALAHQFGIFETTANHRISRFTEKPHTPPGSIPHQPGYALASMGNYMFDANALYQLLQPLDPAAHHDFGCDLLPTVFQQQQASVYDFGTNQLPGEQSLPHYWRDVGTLAAYYQSKLDVLHHTDWLEGPAQRWPILTGDKSQLNRKRPITAVQRMIPPAHLRPYQ